MDANASGWIAAYLEWADADACAIEAPGSAAGNTPDIDACSCTETAAAYLDWMTAASFGRRAGDRGRAAVASDAAALHDFREAMLLKALETEADCLHILRRAVDQSDSPAIRLIVDALADADRLCQDEQRAWNALAMLRMSALASPYAFDGRFVPGTWPQALDSVAGDVRALAAKVMALELH